MIRLEWDSNPCLPLGHMSQADVLTAAPSSQDAIHAIRTPTVHIAIELMPSEVETHTIVLTQFQSLAKVLHVYSW